ncbi:MAG: FAD:protein FMN transferase [Acidobacteria bacterium]|nr:FAD:protein FMN transferase [Acidobacteriota bacterium]
MGTQFKIILYASNAKIAHRAARKAFTRIRRLDAIMSDYQETSELNQFSHQGANKPIKLSRDLFRVLDHSQKLAARTAGAFDVTVGVLTRLWRRARRTGELPDQAHLAHALSVTGYQKLHLDAKTQTAWLEAEGMLLDVGGIAKGYAADAALRVLQQQGIRSALVAAGGDIAVSDAPPHQHGWVVAVAGTNAARINDDSTIYLRLANAAVSTSGDAHQFVEIDGTRYSHIVDPHTGLGLEGQMSVTVVARRGTAADALATAVSVLGKERGLNLIDETTGAAALLIKKRARGFVISASKRWQEVEKRSKVSAKKAAGAAAK